MQNELALDLMEEEMEMQMAMQESQAAQEQQGQEQPGQEGAPPEGLMEGEPGEQAGASPGLSPAEGDLPPAMFAPEDNAEGAGNPFMGTT